MGNPFPGPQSSYQNPPINPQYFQPRQYFISSITLGQTTTITTTVNHDYVIGQLCRLLIPQYNGTYQLNEQLGYVESIPESNQVVLNIDSSVNVGTFMSSTKPNQPQILAVGDIQNGYINANGLQNNQTAIPGSFVNISPM